MKKKKFQVGDKVKIVGKDGELVEGIIIDFDVYQDKIVFKIETNRGEIDMSEEQLHKALLRRRQ